ncbi:glycosyltransferase [Paracidobacterium acidisoli]|uniref:Glycosyltransferase family 1 protein n=1 Tax=Paracidobacterium acidisoli TaxID=2303751 RepID=A0A372IN45_9BACT|nr:glycosyltransferase [Paracidobacterium acidisoli]MBT9331954.1 glycosyltransferase [Paracidobacterium acidisoli]
MIFAVLRVAYFPDSFHEINGVAHTSRHFEAFARRRGLPFLCVRAGNRRPRLVREGHITTLELPRGPISFGLDKDLRFDVAWIRHLPSIARVLREFRPDIVHITGPSDVGIFGAVLANHYHLPMAAAWHTNVHEYAAKRADWLLRWLPEGHAPVAAQYIEGLSLDASAHFYATARVLFAPNPGLCNLLEAQTGRPCHLMQRGIDTYLFSPEHRNRAPQDSDFVLGFVGRLSVEKNIALLAQIQQELEARGIRNFRFLIVGQGAEEQWLRERLPRAEFSGVLRGEALSRAYANMDLFLFPSHTDTFGNVVLEALASGVPAVVTPDGGPRYIIREGATGFSVQDADFSAVVARIMGDPALHLTMRTAARRDALGASWDSVFEDVYAAYRQVLPDSPAAAP